MHHKLTEVESDDHWVPTYHSKDIILVRGPGRCYFDLMLEHW